MPSGRHAGRRRRKARIQTARLSQSVQTERPGKGFRMQNTAGRNRTTVHTGSPSRRNFLRLSAALRSSFCVCAAALPVRCCLACVPPLCLCAAALPACVLLPYSYASAFHSCHRLACVPPAHIAPWEQRASPAAFPENPYAASRKFGRDQVRKGETWAAQNFFEFFEKKTCIFKNHRV